MNKQKKQVCQKLKTAEIAENIERICIPCWPLLRRPLLALILASWRY